MTWSIQEGDFLPVDLHYISANVLCDTAGLPICYICVPDRVQKRSLSMIYMAHDTDDRRTFYHQAFIFLVLFQKFLNHIDDFFLFAENVKFHRDLFRCIKIDLLIDCYNLALEKQFLDNNRRHHFHLVCKFFNRKDFRDHDLFDLLLFLFLLLGLWLLYFDCLFLFSSLLAFSFKSFISVFFFLIITFFVFYFVSLAFLLFYHRGAHVISAGISPVSPRPCSA